MEPIQISDMEIEWKFEDRDPFLERMVVEFPGIRIHRVHVLPGRLFEHANPLHEINVTVGGTLRTEKHTATGQRVETQGFQGNICITPAGQPIGASWDEPLDNLGMFLEPNFVSAVASENGFSPNVEFAEVFQQNDPLIQSLGLSLLKAGSAAVPMGKLYTDSLVQTLTLHLLSNYRTSGRVPAPAIGGLSGYKLRRVIEFIDAKLDEDLDLHEIAAIAELSPFHFSRAFRKTTGTTPLQYVMRCRVERAKELLTHGDLPIVEISLKTGFKTQSHFTALFRKHTSFTPKRWRELKLA